MTDTLISTKLRLIRQRKESKPENTLKESTPTTKFTYNCTTEHLKDPQKEFHCIHDEFDDYMELRNNKFFDYILFVSCNKTSEKNIC